MGNLVDRAADCNNDQDLRKLEDHLQKLILAEMMKKQDPDPAPVQRKKRLANMSKSIKNSRSIKPTKPKRYVLQDIEEEDDRQSQTTEYGTEYETTEYETEYE